MESVQEKITDKKIKILDLQAEELRTQIINSKRWLTREEAYAYLSVSRPTFDRLVLNGQIRKSKLDSTLSGSSRSKGKVLFDRLELDRMVERQKE